MSAPTTCLAVDDHPTVRHGLGLMFGDIEDLELVGHVDSGEEVIEAIERLRPQVVIMDVRLPGIDGISAVKRIAGPARRFTRSSSQRTEPSACSPTRSRPVLSAYVMKGLAARGPLCGPSAPSRAASPSWTRRSGPRC